MITLFSIIKEDWNSSMDTDLNTLIKAQSNLSSFQLMNPYSAENVDITISEIENKLKNRKYHIEETNIWEIYKELYWYTQFQVNLWEYLNFYKSLRDKYNVVLEYLTENIKYKNEIVIRNKVSTIFKNKEEEISNLLVENEQKKLTTIENKFLTTKIQNIEDKYNHQLSPYLWNKLNANLQNQIKRDKILLEFQRKILIIEKIVWYFEIRYKTFQEEINTHKKVIDNLVFLINNLNK